MQLSTLYSNQSSSELSVYNDLIASSDKVKTELKKLVAAFPELSDDFIIILTERIVSNKFTVQRVKDAVNNLIDNFTYKKPNVADVISWDKRIKLLTYQQVINLVNEQGALVWDNYKKVVTPHKVKMWAAVQDIENYKLELL